MNEKQREIRRKEQKPNSTYIKLDSRQNIQQISHTELATGQPPHTQQIEDSKNLNFIICIRLNLCVCVLSVGNYATEKQAFEYKWRPLYCDSDICFRILFRVNCQSFEENAFYECVSCYSKCENGAHSPQNTHTNHLIFLSPIFRRSTSKQNLISSILRDYAPKLLMIV